MDELHSKLHETYINLKKRKFFKEDETEQKRFSGLQDFQQSVEELLECLRNDNYRLHDELCSLQKINEENLKLLHAKTLEGKELCNEVVRLRELLAKKDEKIEEANQNVTPGSRKSRRLSKSTCAQEEEIDKNVEDVIQQDIVTPSCCRRTLDNSGDMNDSVSSVLHSLVETSLDIKISIDSQSEEPRISVNHIKSGFAFSLTWAKNEGELRYQPSSLGTLERVASSWMKEEIIFTMNMFSMFFQRVSHVLTCAN